MWPLLTRNVACAMMNMKFFAIGGGIGNEKHRRANQDVRASSGTADAVKQIISVIASQMKKRIAVYVGLLEERKAYLKEFS